MLDYRTSSLLFVLSMLMIALSGLFINIAMWSFLIPIFIYLLLLIHGTISISTEFFMPVICNGPDDHNGVSITFDDGPSPETTPRILDILKENEVKAAFFCIGEKVAENPEIMKRIVAEGHIIGNHSYSHHFFFDLLSHDNMVREIRNTNKAIEKIGGKKIHLFRPPYGVTTPILAKAVKKTKMTSVGWSLRSFDTTTNDPVKLINYIDKKLKAGDVILLHDTREVTVEALQAIIDKIDDREFAILPVDQLLNINAYV